MVQKKPVEQIEVVDPSTGETVMVTPVIWRGYMRGNVFVRIEAPEPKRMPKAVEQQLRSEALVRDQIREAHKHPTAVEYRPSPSERLAPDLERTSKPVLEYIKAIEGDRATLLKDYMELQRIAEAVLEDMDRSVVDGEKGGRPKAILPANWWDEREKIRKDFKRERQYHRMADLYLDAETADRLSTSTAQIPASRVSAARREKARLEKSET